jgi:hypothetical protein
MARGGLMIDVLAGPGRGDESADEFADEAPLEDEAATPKADPEALISGIEAQLAQLRAWAAGR